MRTLLRLAALGSLLLAGLAFADDDASRAKLIGSWQSEDAKDARTWTIQEKGDNLHVVHTVAGKMIAEFECDSFGHDCTIKDNGKTAKLSLYYNGPKLIALETKGSTIVQRTFLITADDTLQVEVAQIAPAAKTETIKFKRSAAASAQH